MVIDMEDARLQTSAPVRAFLDGATEIAVRVPKVERCSFIERVLTRCGDAAPGRIGKGVGLRDRARLTGLSRQHVPRLVRRDRQEGTLSTRHGPPQHGFRRRFTATDVALLAARDARHRTGSAPAAKTLMERAFLVFKDTRFERLAGISVLPSVQSTPRDPVPAPATTLDDDAAHRRPHRPAPRAPAEWEAGL